METEQIDSLHPRSKLPLMISNITLIYEISQKSQIEHHPKEPRPLKLKLKER